MSGSGAGSKLRAASGARRAIVWCASIAAALMLSSVQAGTIVRFGTTFGDFSVELLDDTAPITVQNFLNYLGRGDYAGTLIHRAVPGVVQGGGYHFVPYVGMPAIETDPPIVNEFGASNTRGTIAMAKLGGKPDSATSQWFFNLSDNSAQLDVDNGGFTVFGQVLGDGLGVVEAIGASPNFNLGGLAANIPLRGDTIEDPRTINYVTVKTEHFIHVNPMVTQRYSAAMHVFESSSGLLITSVDGGEGLGAYSLNLSLVGSDPQPVFELNAESMVALAINPDGMASYNEGEGRLSIPVVEVNDNGALSNIYNVQLVLSDAQLMRFTLESFDTNP